MALFADRHIAQFNWGILADDWGSARVAEFENNIDRVNGIAGRSAGYVWHMPGDRMEAAQKDRDGPLGGHPRMASTLSVWESTESLDQFVHNTVHSYFMNRRDISHIKQPGPTYVIWPIEVGHIPTLNEAQSRLKMLGVNGPTKRAFDFEWLRTNASLAE